MALDPICGMEVKESKAAITLKKGEEIFYFCSSNCRKKFAERYQIDLSKISDPRSTIQILMQNKTSALLLATALGCLLSYQIPVLEPFRTTIFLYVKKIWWAVLLGLTLGGIMDHFVPREYISHTLSRREKRTVLKAVGLGFLMSICSHGILALSMELYKKGASTSSVVTFLLASPWANFPFTLMMIGFFGVAKALYIILAAIVIAITSGLIYQQLEARQLVETNPMTVKLDDSFSIKEDLLKRFREYRFSGAQLGKDLEGVRQGIIGVSQMVMWWIVLGTVLASLAGAYIPAHIFHQYMGPTFGGMLVTLALATVIEVCSEGTSPLAFEIYRQTGALGNSLVFLMAGVSTDYTEIGLIWQNIGRKAALFLPLVTVPQVILFGIIANIIFK